MKLREVPTLLRIRAAMFLWPQVFERCNLERERADANERLLAEVGDRSDGGIVWGLGLALMEVANDERVPRIVRDRARMAARAAARVEP